MAGHMSPPCLPLSRKELFEVLGSESMLACQKRRDQPLAVRGLKTGSRTLPSPALVKEKHPPTHTHTEPAGLTCLLGGLPQCPLHSPAVRVVPTTDTTLVIRLHGSHFFVTTKGLEVEVRSAEGGSPASTSQVPWLPPETPGPGQRGNPGTWELPKIHPVTQVKNYPV